MYGKKGRELVKEIAGSEPGQMVAFNSNLFTEVKEECNLHFQQLQSLLSKFSRVIEQQMNKFELDVQGKLTSAKLLWHAEAFYIRSVLELWHNIPENNKTQEGDSSDQATKNGDHFGALIHHLSLVRNKRCLMSYLYNRAEVLRNLGWAIYQPQLPVEIHEKLSSSEKEYFKNHYATLRSYISELDIDLAVDMVPPKDPYVKVRVLDDMGEVVLTDQTAMCTRHAILFLRRIDAESYISQGLMEELTD